MALNAEDRDYISRINEDTKNHIEQVHDLKMNLILQELKFIKEQTTKTNGTVITHSKEISELQKTGYTYQRYLSKSKDHRNIG